MGLTKKVLINIENNLNKVLFFVTIFRKSFNQCYDDYDFLIKDYRKNRDLQIKKYNEDKEIINNYYYDSINYAKESLKKCLSDKGDFLAELKGLRTRVSYLKENIEVSRNSVPRLKKRLNKINKKIMRISAEIDALEGKN